jgi:hypothetical protein
MQSEEQLGVTGPQAIGFLLLEEQPPFCASFLCKTKR